LLNQQDANKNSIIEKLIDGMILIVPVLFLGNRKLMKVQHLPNVLASCYPFVICCLAPGWKAESGESNRYQQVPEYLGVWKSRGRLHVLVALQTLSL